MSLRSNMCAIACRGARRRPASLAARGLVSEACQVVLDHCTRLAYHRRRQSNPIMYLDYNSRPICDQSARLGRRNYVSGHAGSVSEVPHGMKNKSCRMPDRTSSCRPATGCLAQETQKSPIKFTVVSWPSINYTAQLYSRGQHSVVPASVSVLGHRARPHCTAAHKS